MFYHVASKCINGLVSPPFESMSIKELPYQGWGEHKQGPPPPYYRSSIDSSPANLPDDYLASGMGIGRISVFRENRRRDRDDGIEIGHFDDDRRALRCDSWCRDSERRGEREMSYFIEEAKTSCRTAHSFTPTSSERKRRSAALTLCGQPKCCMSGNS